MLIYRKVRKPKFIRYEEILTIQFLYPTIFIYFFFNLASAERVTIKQGKALTVTSSINTADEAEDFQDIIGIICEDQSLSLHPRCCQQFPFSLLQWTWSALNTLSLEDINEFPSIRQRNGRAWATKVVYVWCKEG